MFINFPASQELLLAIIVRVARAGCRLNAAIARFFWSNNDLKNTVD